MTAITVSNADETILAALQATLQDVTIDGRRLFERVALPGSRAEAEDRNFTASPTAAVIYEATDTYDVPDLNVGCVLRATVMVAATEDTPALRSGELTRLLGAARNALHTSPPAGANGFAEPGGGDYHPRIRIDTPDRDEKATDPWAIAWLPVEVAYRVATNSSH